MGKILVLAEKPSVGKDIGKVLNCRKINKSYIEGDKYIVTWAMGHLVTLEDPEAYGAEFKKWSFESLPMIPPKMKLCVIKKTAHQFFEIKKLLHRNDVDELVIATDAGREGELVARWIIEKAGFRKRIKRLFISSQTDRAIRDGFNNLRNSREYDNLFKAAEARAEADWLVGLNATRALTCRYNAQLSAGRVQSPTLYLIVKREDEIQNFKPENYYNIVGKCKDFNILWNKNGNTRLWKQEEGEKIVEKLKGKDCIVTDIKETNKKTFPKLLYDLTELQRDGNKLFGYSPKTTLNIMQRLYENHKVLTYPRTDSRYLSSDIVSTIKERLMNLPSKYSKFSNEIVRMGIKTNKNIVDDSKVSDHHAIIPTEEKCNYNNLSIEEKNIYDLVIKRFISVFYGPFEYTEYTVTLKAENETFTSKGMTVKENGFKKVYGNDHDEENEELANIPRMNKGDKIQVLSFNLDKKQTTPPKRFNEGTLLSAMERPQDYVELNNEYSKILCDAKGIGTVATRADIMEKLFNSFYIEKNGKEIIPTSKGKQIIELVPADLKSPLLTAKWEKQLELISTGKEKKENFINDMKEYTKNIVVAVKESKEKYIHDNLTGEKCPNCSKYLLLVKGKNGMMNVCQDRNCGYREVISSFSNARCPECHKKLEIRGEGEGKIYFCKNCSFREKYKKFNERFNNNDRVNKKTINVEIKKINKENEGNLNTSLMDALKDFKF